MGNFIVYKHITPNNKVYIGITCQEPKKRWQYGKGYINCKYFYKAIKKYGWKNIKHEILFENLSREEAMQKEIELIKKYNSNNKKYGYNLTKGGDGNFGVVFTEKRKKNISKSKIGHIVSEETRQKLSKNHKGSNNWNYGLKMPKETREKISKAHKGMKFTPEHISKMNTFKKGHIPWNKGKNLSQETIDKIIATRKSKAVLCIETNTKYYSIREAYRQTSINYNRISEVCKGIRETAGGYHWQLLGGVE